MVRRAQALARPDWVAQRMVMASALLVLVPSPLLLDVMPMICLCFDYVIWSWSG